VIVIREEGGAESKPSERVMSLPAFKTVLD
jgi:hypothetical protein